MVKKIFIVFLAVLLVLILFNWELVAYGTRQGYGQLKIVMDAKPIAELMDDPVFPDSLKRKLELIQEIRKYAIDSLGLKDTKNYKPYTISMAKKSCGLFRHANPFS
jgi:predicted aminopeptidase